MGVPNNMNESAILLTLNCHSCMAWSSSQLAIIITLIFGGHLVWWLLVWIHLAVINVGNHQTHCHLQVASFPGLLSRFREFLLQ